MIPKIDIPDHLVWVTRAFDRLTLDRAWHGSGMGPALPSPIAFATITHYADWQGYSPQETRFLDACLQAMDRVFLDHTRQEIAARSKS